MNPGYTLDIPRLHAAISPWLPANPTQNELVRPNQETVQLCVQLQEHGFGCHIQFRTWRVWPEGPTRSVFQLTPHILLGGVKFDAKTFEPYEVVEQYCQTHDINWEDGDAIDQGIGPQMLRNMQQNAQSIPNIGLYRAIEDALSSMQRDHIDLETPAASGGKRSGGRL